MLPLPPLPLALCFAPAPGFALVCDVGFGLGVGLGPVRGVVGRGAAVTVGLAFVSFLPLPQAVGWASFGLGRLIDAEVRQGDTFTSARRVIASDIASSALATAEAAAFRASPRAPGLAAVAVAPLVSVGVLAPTRRAPAGDGLGPASSAAAGVVVAVADVVVAAVVGVELVGTAAGSFVGVCTPPCSLRCRAAASSLMRAYRSEYVSVVRFEGCWRWAMDHGWWAVGGKRWAVGRGR